MTLYVGLKENYADVLSLIQSLQDLIPHIIENRHHFVFHVVVGGVVVKDQGSEIGIRLSLFDRCLHHVPGQRSTQGPTKQEDIDEKRFFSLIHHVLDSFEHRVVERGMPARIAGPAWHSHIAFFKEQAILSTIRNRVGVAFFWPGTVIENRALVNPFDSLE